MKNIASMHYSAVAQLVMGGAARYTRDVSWLREMTGDAVPPAGLADWAAQHTSALAAWRDCPRPDWQLWLAAHVRGRTHDDERGVVSSGLAAREGGPLIIDIMRYVWPIPTERDILDTWARDGAKTLTLEQRLIASGVSFAIALIVGIAIDQTWGARFGIGIGRTAWQAFLTLVIWLPLTPPMRALRRRWLRRAVVAMSFDEAFSRVWKPLHARAESMSESDRRSLAQKVRLSMAGVTKRHFA